MKVLNFPSVGNLKKSTVIGFTTIMDKEEVLRMTRGFYDLWFEEKGWLNLFLKYFLNRSVTDTVLSEVDASLYVLFSEYEANRISQSELVLAVDWLDREWSSVRVSDLEQRFSKIFSAGKVGFGSDSVNVFVQLQHHAIAMKIKSALLTALRLELVSKKVAKLLRVGVDEVSVSHPRSLRRLSELVKGPEEMLFGLNLGFDSDLLVRRGFMQASVRLAELLGLKPELAPALRQKLAPEKNSSVLWEDRVCLYKPREGRGSSVIAHIVYSLNGMPVDASIAFA